MKIQGLKSAGTKPEVVRSKSGKTYETGEKVQMFRAPDGTRGTYKFFLKEAERGRLHGCLISSGN
jgi:hypothetical protein